MAIKAIFISYVFGEKNIRNALCIKRMMQMASNKNKDFSIITEHPDQKATSEQLQRLFQRYNFAKSFTAGKAVLEVACGSGIGLGYMADTAKIVVGGDIEEKNILAAQGLCSGRCNVETLLLDAEDLPFEHSSFDVLLIFEAIYYLKNPEKFIAEAYRVLKDNGKLIVCTVNKDWEDFHPSKYSTSYYSVPELDELLTGTFPEVRIYGAFRVEKGGVKAKAFSLIKGAASRLEIIPGSLRARELLKRIFIGELKPIPNEIYEGMAQYVEPYEIENDKPTDEYKIIYAVAAKGSCT